MRAWWAAASPRHRAALIAGNPRLVGNTDGIPFADRDRANRTLVRRHLVALRRELAAAERTREEATDDVWDTWPGFNRDIDDTEAELLRLDLAIAMREEWLAGERHTVIAYDTAGDGRAVVAIGDLDRATHVAVVVPGITNTINNFHDTHENAVRLQEEMQRAEGSRRPVAIAWLGYDTPSGDSLWGGNPFEAAQSDKAKQGAPQLRRFTHELAAETPARAEVTVVGHSYGSTTAGRAALGDLDADRLVLVGSPGASADHASEYTVPQDEVYAAVTPDDPIRFVHVGDRSPHGADPTAPEFGAEVFTSAPASGHSQYFSFDTDALTNLGVIATDGDPTLVLESE